MSESDRCSEIPESNMEILKEALRAQQQLLQKVYFELEEEREASSSAASEAMLKILRLQAEKAQVKMEASQYKREAEEKMCFAEESLAILEDLMYQKEMEIANLEFQVQAYVNKLQGVGCSDLSIPDDHYFESPDHEQDMSETGSTRSVNVTPGTHFARRLSVDRDRPAIPVPNLFQKKSSMGALNAYREQIRTLGEQVNKISDDRISRRSHVNKGSRNRFRSCSVPPPKAEEESPKTDEASIFDVPKITRMLVERKANSSDTSPTGVRDF